mmetsp:Transcript_58739/g.138347  ORF Transcript_58739/g.138347 Transcript_58739/m.138347 type:complete len:231 (-) Transcript_58739:59-751(-)
MCAFSAMAGIFMEHFLKKGGDEVPLMLQTIQQCVFSVVIQGAILASRNPGILTSPTSIIDGFGTVGWVLVANNTLYGIASATVMKLGDNVIRLFSVAASVAIVTAISAYHFDFPLSPVFAGSVMCMLLAFFLFTVQDRRNSALQPSSSGKSHVKPHVVTKQQLDALGVSQDANLAQVLQALSNQRSKRSSPPSSPKQAKQPELRRRNPPSRTSRSRSRSRSPARHAIKRK